MGLRGKRGQEKILFSPPFQKYYLLGRPQEESELNVLHKEEVCKFIFYKGRKDLYLLAHTFIFINLLYRNNVLISPNIFTLFEIGSELNLVISQVCTNSRIFKI